MAPERRARLVNAIAETMERTRGRGSMGRARYWAFAAAAGAALVLGFGVIGWYVRGAGEPVTGRVTALFGPASTVIHGREVTSLVPTSGSLPMAFDSHLDTGRDSASRLELASGVEIAVGSDTHMALPHTKDRVGGREELGLEGGFIYVDVPKLRPGHVFAIHTPDTWITVHGTSFSVEVSGPGAGPLSTKVDVTEGTVTVQKTGNAEIFLTAGTRWISIPEAAALSSASAASPEAHTVSVPVRPAPAAALDVSGAASPVAGPDALRGAPVAQTALAQQNRIFAQAMTVRVRGNGAEAIEMLEAFIQRYPASPLTQDAHVELFRGFVQMGDRAAAARAARRYLALYGDGFARDEARALALEPGAAPLP
jgi:hypothetical protein